MLELHEITKSYRTASLDQTALDGVTVSFRDNEFVAVLGQSGSGKTTMLNVIGGLDHFDSGDLVIDGISTKHYRNRDWDAYRNNRIGFVFQSYNLIPHQSVLANVELALTLTGVSRGERRRRALEALDQVGLSEHVHKRPSQLSGGQMQRVAIARALINDPEILLADEPTGALDSGTSIQVMDLLREVAADRLVIMVTHNPELAHDYATRIVELADGRITSDTAPYIPAGEDAREARPPRRTRMGPLTALSLSFSNLMTKKGRTLMTSFAGSIGIIGIAMILALANGVNAYIARTEEETLSSYPLQIERLGMDYTSLIAQATETATQDDLPDGVVGERRALSNMLGSANTNDLAALKSYFDADGGSISDYTNAIEYLYDVTPQLYLPVDADSAGQMPTQVNPDTAFSSFGAMTATMQMTAFQQLAADTDLYADQYELASGRWPTAYNELVIVLPEDGRMSDLTEYALGLREHSELEQLVQTYVSGMAGGLPGSSAFGGATSTAAAADSATDPATDPATGPATEPATGATAQAGAEATADAAAEPAATVGATSSATAAAGDSADSGAERTYAYNDLIGRTLTLVPAHERYVYDADYDVWTDKSSDAAYMSGLVAAGETVSVVGIVRANGSQAALVPGVYYPPALTEHLVEQAAASDIVKAQLARPEVNVFTGKTFAEEADAAGDTEFDISNLFTVDEAQLQLAFQIDPSALDLSGMDLSGVDLSGLDTTQMDFSGLDLSGLDAVQPEIDLSDLDLSSLSLTDLEQQFPQLADVDYVALITQALSDGVIKEGADAQVSAMMTGLIADFTDYYGEHAAGEDPDDPADDPDLGTLVTDYLTQEEVQRTIAQTLGSDDVIDSAKLTENLTAALGTDPAVADISDAVRDQLVAEIGSQVAGAVAGSITDALSSAVQQAMAAAMAQMMTTIQSQIAAQVQAATTQLATGLADAMSVDADAFAEAFQLEMTPEELSQLLATLVSTEAATYESNLSALGWADLDNPSEIDIYPKNFEAKDSVKQILEDYNAQQAAAGADDKVITYTDVVGVLMSSVTRIVNIISWMLIAFVAISLVVSSIMIAIITYISVLERRKEIGILRAVGASKADVRHVFNAETVIEGLLAGVMGVGITLLVSLPVNAFIYGRFGVESIAQLPVTAGVVLILISVGLTVLAGLIPAGKAAREDPVEALRSE
ncbi:ABC transporter permease [Actinomyces sp. 432]|uniref:ABC transporter ATP-binding protein/permease n=1 Tax=Actinomyces sp. 432 TaxID=2057798 RepID=UPI001374251B|nr:ABC transporter ATP-binding protein/permease [Actinomyces sp. 432]QHO91532.1 ABC transporter permease [Actinomyces sp. 432]